MPKKPKVRAPRKRRASTVAADERLREELRNADMRKFDKAIDKAIRPHPHPSR